MKMNKKNFKKLSLIFTFSVILYFFSINYVYAAISTDNQIDDDFQLNLKDIGATYDHETSTMEVSNVEDESFTEDYLSENNVENIKSKDGSVIKIGDGIESVEIKDGIAKIVFSDTGKSNTLSFEKDGKQYEISAEKGVVELTENGIILQEGMSFKTDDGKSFTSMKEGTKILLLGKTIEIKGKASFDYSQNFLTEIKLVGKDSSLIILKSEKEKTEFTNIDGEDFIIKTGEFHKSEGCIGNCISYQEMGVGTNNIDYWNKIKIDGNALITEYYNEKIAYAIQFKDGNAVLHRDLSKLESSLFSEKTIINYNGGEKVTFVIETSEERAEQVGKARIHSYKGDDIESNPNVQIFDNAEALGGIQTPNKGTPSTPENNPHMLNLEEKAKNVYVDDKNLYEILDGILEDRGEEPLSEDLVLSWIWQESAMNENAELGGCVGFTQVSAISFRDVINRNPEKYKKYQSYTDEQLTEAIEDDPLLNLEVGFDYMHLLNTVYGFSQEKLESNYKYTGTEEDIILVAYNAGPTVTKDIMASFKEKGGGSWDKLEEFLNTEEAFNIFKKYKSAYGLKYETSETVIRTELKKKISIVINYVNRIKSTAEYQKNYENQ
ncbi:MAG: hypothetical protein PHV16_02710 [Candidatus Nanoarchaeia archaeon]|nr:hypothetical protein [Candidatus Nanoarchaeia archaeon]